MNQNSYRFTTTMSNAIINAATVILIFFIGYAFKQQKLTNIDTAKKMSAVVIYISLPCAILSGSAGAIDINPSLFFVVPLSFLISFTLPFTGYLLYRKNPEKCVFVMLNLGGFNIGNFILPFMQNILTPEGFIALCLFDLINAFFCFGGVYCMALWFNRNGYNSGEKINLKKIFLELSKSVTSFCCILSVALAALSITLPEFLLHPIKVIGGSNSFLCMLIIGMALNFNVNIEKVKKSLEIILIRYGMATVFGVAVFMMLPYSAMVRLIIMAMVFAPITSIAPITALRSLPKFAEDSANLNMVSIIISAVIITLITAFHPVLLSL